MYKSFKEMPIFLKFITAHALVCFLLFVAAVIPEIPIIFNDEVMETQELWEKGIGIRFHLAISGLAMPATGILILKRWHYARQFYALLLISLLVAPYIVWQDLISTIYGMVLAFSIIGYMFFHGQARAYFSS